MMFIANQSVYMREENFIRQCRALLSQLLGEEADQLHAYLRRTCKLSPRNTFSEEYNLPFWSFSWASKAPSEWYLGQKRQVESN